MEQWTATNDMCSNTSKTKEMVFTLARGLVVSPLTIGGNTTEQVAAFKLLGVTVTSNLSWFPHTKTVRKNSQPAAVLVVVHETRRTPGTGAAGALHFIHQTRT